MKKIPLTQGKFALVDNSDFEWLNQWKWYATKDNSTYYAVRWGPRNKGKRKKIIMHREIMNTPETMDVDHADHNGLNNQRINLRNATRSQNMSNRLIYKNNTTGTKGVYREGSRYAARVAMEGKRIYLGSFDTIEAAQKAYVEAAIKMQGDFFHPGK